jgi:hypothetical protein
MSTKLTESLNAVRMSSGLYNKASRRFMTPLSSYPACHAMSIMTFPIGEELLVPQAVKPC